MLQRNLLCCSVAAVGCLALAVTLVTLKKQKQKKNSERHEKMVFKFLKKIFGSENGGDGRLLTGGLDPGTGNSSQSKEVVVGEEAKAEDAKDKDALITLNKWINLLDCFVDSWSKHLSKVEVMEVLKERLLTVDPLIFGGDCTPQVSLKESSNIIDDGTQQLVATVLEIGDLLLFNGIAPELNASRTVALERAYDFLLDLRDLISNFKKAFYFTDNDQKAIVETLVTSNGRMFQRNEIALEIPSGTASCSFFSASITLTNMAYFCETATSQEAAARSVAHQACEHLRKVAQIGSAQMRNIYGNGGGGKSSIRNISGSSSQTTKALAATTGEPPNKPSGNVCDDKKKPVIVSSTLIKKDEVSTVKNSSSNSAQPSTSALASTSSTSSSPAPARPLPEVKLTCSLTDAKLINRWAVLIGNFSSVTGSNKSKWQTRRELELKDSRDSNIFVRPFRETIKSEENGEDQYVYWGIAEVYGLLKLKEKGKDEKDAKDNALGAVFRFLKQTLEMLRYFRRKYQTEKDKTSRGLIKALHGQYPALLTVQVEKEQVEGGRGGPPSPLYTVTIELLKVATFKATSTNKQAAREAASKALADLLLKIWPSKDEKVMIENGNTGSKPAETFTVEIGTPKKSTVFKVEVDEVDGGGGGGVQPVLKPSVSSSPTPAASDSVASNNKNHQQGPVGASKVFFNKSLTAKLATSELKPANSGHRKYLVFHANGGAQKKSFAVSGGGVFPTTKPNQPSKVASSGGSPQQAPQFSRKQQRKQLCLQKQQQCLQKQQQENGELSKSPAAKKMQEQDLKNVSNGNAFKKPDLEPSDYVLTPKEVEEELKEDVEEMDEEEEEDFWKALECVSVSSSTSPSLSLTSPSSPTVLSPDLTLPLPPSFAPSPSHSEEAAPTPTILKLKKVGGTGTAKITEVTVANAVAYSEEQLRAQIPALVQMISRYSDAVNKDSKLDGIFSESLQAVFSGSSLTESFAWTVLHAMQAAGQEISHSLTTTEENENGVPSRQHLFTLNIEVQDSTCWRSFVFTGTSPTADGLYLDGPPCREEAARAAVDWLANLANLLEQFTQLYVANSCQSSEGLRLPLKDPAELIKELKRRLLNRHFLRMSPISKKGGKGGKNSYSCSVIIDRLATFVGVGGFSGAAEAAAAQKTINFLLELLQTKVVVADE